MAKIKTVLKTLLHRVFDIREGEYRTAILMQLNIFLLISTLLIVKPNVTALFLSKFGAERLPEAFILVAVTALIFSMLYIRLLDAKSFHLIVERTLLISFLVMVLFLVLLKTGLVEGAVLYLFYIWVAVFALLTTSQFWVLANLVYNIREAKRLFSFIGAGAISGGIFGGYLTTILAPWIGSENVLLTAAFFLLACIPVTRLIWTENITTLSVFRRKKRMGGLSENPIRVIVKSKHLFYLAGIIGVGVVVAKFVDYQFNDIAHRNITNPDELAAFFGFWFSTLNLISLFIQLFLTPKIVGRWGIGTSLMFLPASILVSAVILLLFPGLAAAVLIKAADGSFKQSINKSAVELLGLPIPVEVKNRTKTFIDVVVDSMATGIAGFCLMFIVKALEMSTRYVSIFIILLIALWVYLAVRVRREYIKSFKSELVQVTDQVEPAPFLPGESVMDGIETILEKGEEDQILFMLNKVREIEIGHLIEPVRELLTHSSPRIRAEAIHTLYSHVEPSTLEEVQQLVHDPDHQVKLAAFTYLFAHDQIKTTENFETWLDHPDPDTADAALLALALETRNNQTLKETYRLNERIRQRIRMIEMEPDAERSGIHKCRMLEVIGHANSTDYFTYISDCLEDGNEEVVRKAIIGAGLTLDSQFIQPLVSFLDHTSLGEDAVTSLVGYGIPVIESLTDLIQKREVPGNLLHRIPAVIERLDSQEAVDALVDLLDDEDLELRLEAIRSLNNLKGSAADLIIHKQKLAKLILEEGQLYLNTLSAMYAEIIVNFKKERSSRKKHKEEEARRNLIEILEQRLDNDLERIFRLLDLKYPTENIELAFRGIRSSNPDHRVNAIEFLDNLLEPDLKRVLIPIVETTILDAISEDSLRSLSFKVPSERECFEILLSRKDQEVKLAVLKLLRCLEDKSYLPIVAQYAESNSSQVRQYANTLLNQLNDDGTEQS